MSKLYIREKNQDFHPCKPCGVQRWHRVFQYVKKMTYGKYATEQTIKREYICEKCGNTYTWRKNGKKR